MIDSELGKENLCCIGKDLQWKTPTFVSKLTKDSCNNFINLIVAIVELPKYKPESFHHGFRLTTSGELLSKGQPHPTFINADWVSSFNL